METFQQTLVIILLVVGVVEAFPFKQNYHAIWGGKHLAIINETRAELLLDRNSGAAFGSNLNYRSGFLRMRIKMPANQSPGVVTTFYLDSRPDGDQKRVNHDEIDFEFIGTNDKPYLNTNIYTNDMGGREQSIRLWFDPTADFHSYDFIWNAHQVAFLVDTIPIRVFKNNSRHGLGYLSGIMHAKSSLWNAPWAGPIKWVKGPFKAQFESFVILGCPAYHGPVDCASQTHPWNRIWALNSEQRKQYEDVRKKYMFYDYCVRFPKKECGLPSH